jgi:DNA repair protein RecO (recombination protein O)
MPSYKTEGVILKRSNFGEADRILTIYTKHYGKIQAIAKGVRKITSRKGGNLELFNHCVLFLAKGRNLDIITEAQVVNSFSRLGDDLEKAATAFYLVELVDQLTADGQINRQVFDLLVGGLTQISADANADERGESVGQFEVNLLRLLGFWSDSIDRRSVKGYIEEIIERKLRSPEFQQKLDNTSALCSAEVFDEK